MELPQATIEQLQQVAAMRDKARDAGNTLNPITAKRLATEVLDGAVDLVEQLVRSVGQLQMEAKPCCK
jgi:hypothetical protein